MHYKTLRLHKLHFVEFKITRTVTKVNYLLYWKIKYA